MSANSSGWISAAHHNITPANKQFSLTISTRDLISLLLLLKVVSTLVTSTRHYYQGAHWWISDEKTSSTILCTLNDDKSRLTDEAEKLDIAGVTQTMEFYHPHKRFVYANVIGGLGSDRLLRFQKSQAVRHLHRLHYYMHAKAIKGCRLSANTRFRTCGPPTHLLTHNVLRVMGGKPTRLLVPKEVTTFSQILFKLLSFNLKAANDRCQLLGTVWLLPLTDWFQWKKIWIFC